MPSIQIPGSLCKSLHPDYTGSDSSDEVCRYIRLAAKKMIEGAIQDGLSPAKLPPTVDIGMTQNISFAARDDRVIRDLAKLDGIRESDAARRFLFAAIARGDAINHQIAVVSDAFAPYLTASGRQPRHAQSTFFNCVQDTLGSGIAGKGRIGLIEGATGIGKTLAILGAAAETLRRVAYGRVAVAVPSLQIMSQFIREHRRLAETLPDLPTLRAVVGRQEFVSVTAVQQVLKDGIINVDPGPIRDWLDAGGAANGDGHVLGHDYLCSSLQAVSPDFPIEVARLTSVTSPDDPGAIAYGEQFMRENEGEPLATEILYCTHAMIGVDIRRRLAGARRLNEDHEEFSGAMANLTRQRTKTEDDATRKLLGKDIAALIDSHSEQLAALARDNDIGHLPPWQFLIVDEAHQFETNLANALSSYQSIMSYLSDLRTLQAEGVLSSNAVSRAVAAANALRACALDTGDDLDLTYADTSQSARARAAIAELADAFCSARIKKSAKSNPIIERVRRAAADLKYGIQVAARSQGMLSIVKFSPVRQYPQLFVGRKSIDRELHFLWATTQAAACVSATLYLRRLDVDSAAYFRLILSIPPDRAMEFPPIRPSWVIKPVTGLWIPESRRINNRFWLSPPSRSDRLSAEQAVVVESTWLEEVAGEVRRIHESAAGGTLILMTSYETIKRLSTLLGDALPYKIVASPDHPLAEQRHRFMATAGAGNRPVWLALGAAWTGLDINGADADISSDADNLLTDLVIPRIPFSLNRSMTHHYRTTTNDKVPWELLDTAMRFKQGLGRLVRREGLPINRRIHVLDGRVNDPRFDGYFSLLNRIMGIYPLKRSL